MPQFFRFPAYRAPLARNLALSLAIAGALAIQSPLITALVASIGTIYLAHYGFVVIERVAQGYLNPDHFPPAMSTPVWRPLKLAAIIVAAFFAIAVVTVITGDGALTMLANVAAALLLPASVMTLAVSDSLRQAINPRRVFGLARKIGPSYLVLFVFLLLLMGGSQQAFELIAPALGESMWLLALASSFVGNYFFLIMCALMGYVLYQYSDVLNLPVVGPGEDARDEARPTGGDRETDRSEAAIGRLIVAGDVGGAIALVENALHEDPDDLSLHARLHKLLQIEGSPERTDAHLDRYLELLLRKDSGQAAALAQEARARNADWMPSVAGHVVLLARAALEEGKFDLVLELTHNFETRYRDDEAVSAVMLLRAQALSAGDPADGVNRSRRDTADQHPASDATAAARR